MNALDSLTLGLVQGLTEFIPVSSSGHLVILQYWLNGASEHYFLEFINIGTLLALVVYYRQRIAGILRDIFGRRNSRLAVNIIVTALPAGAVGYLLADVIASNGFFSSLVTVTAALALVGSLMVMLERLPKAAAVDSGEQLPKRRALAIGLVQILALIPGVSRSGSTIIAGRLGGLNAREAAEYSFLASLPIMLGVTAKVFTDADSLAYLADNLPALIIGNIAAFAAGLAAVGFLMRYLKRHSLAVFGWYRLGLAAVLTLALLVS